MPADRPWRRIGVPVDGLVTTQEALKMTGQDWAVAKISQTSAPDLKRKEDSDLFGINNPEKAMTVQVNTRAYLGTVGRGYKVIQNDESCAFLDHALGPRAACVSGVGRLGRFGARFFMMATMPDMLEIVPGDPVERHILLTNTHDCSGPWEAVFVNFRPLSSTVLQTPIEGSEGRVKILHRSKALDHLKTAHLVLAKNQDYWDRATRAYRYMAKRNVDEQRRREFLEAMFPDVEDEKGKRTSYQALQARAAITELFEGSGAGAEAAGETDWGLFNAVAYFVDHERNLSKTQKAHGISHWEISTFGAGANLRARALSWLMKH